MPTLMRHWSVLSPSWPVSGPGSTWQSSKKSSWAAAHKALDRPGERPSGVSVTSLCRRVGMSRQNYYARHQHRRRRIVDGELVAGLVRRERRTQTRLGTRKLYHLLKPELEKAGVRIGWDRMFEELRKSGLLLEPVPAEYPQATQSYHNLPAARQNHLPGRESHSSLDSW